MAEGLDEFATYLKGAALGEFRACPYYEPETDSLICYFRDEKSYSKRITKYFTLFLSCDDDSLVGCEVKGIDVIMKAVENLGDVPLIDPVTVPVEGKNEVNLAVIVRCALVPVPDAPLAGARDELEAQTAGIDIDLDTLCTA